MKKILTPVIFVLLIHVFINPATAQDSRLNILDATYYLSIYPDLKSNFGDNIGSAQSHWLQYGIREGRQGHPDFNMRAYLERYPNLKSQFGTDYQRAFQHWESTGKNQRLDPKPFKRKDLARQVVKGSGPVLYYVDNEGVLHNILDWNTYQGCGLNNNQITTLSDEKLLSSAFGRFFTDANMCQAYRNGATDKPLTASASSPSKTKKYSGKIDPIVELIKAVPNARKILEPFRGILQLENSVGTDVGNNQAFQLVGYINPASVIPRSSNVVAQQLASVLRASMRTFGNSNGAKVEISLALKNAEWDLGFGLYIADGFAKTGSILPEINPEFAFKDAKLVAHVKQAIGAPTLTQELTGTFFFKPSSRDPWMAMQPTMEVDIEGNVTLGGELSGSCGGSINSNTGPGNCKADWNVLSLGVINAKGGVLKVTIDPKKSPIPFGGIEVAVNNANVRGFGPTQMTMSGALLVDTDLSPGIGVALETDREIDPSVFLSKMPFANVEPFRTMNVAMTSASSAGLMPKGKIKWIMAPTGLNVGDINYNGPTFAYKGDFSGLGIRLLTDTELSGDLAKLINGDFSQAGTARSVHSLSFETLNRLIEQGIRSTGVLAPVAGEIVSTFKFQSAKIEADANRGQLNGAVKFTVFGQNVNINVPAEMIYRPDKLAPYIVKKIEHLAGDLGKIVLEGLEIAGKEIAKGAVIAGNGIADVTVAAGTEIAGVATKLFNEIEGVFASRPNDWDVTFKTFPWQVLDYPWFQKTYRPDLPASENWYPLIDFWNPFYKDHAYGWSQWFSPKYYLEANPDVLQATQGQSGIWVNFMRDGEYGFNWHHPDDLELYDQISNANSDYYRSDKNVLNKSHRAPVAPNLYRKAKYEAYQNYIAYKHWLSNGISEGRVGNYFFNTQYYVFKNPDIKPLVAQKGWFGALEHYHNAGRYEQRQTRPKFQAASAPLYNSDKMVPCRVVYDGKMYLGTWHHPEGFQISMCEYPLSNGVTLWSPVFEVLGGDGYSFSPKQGYVVVAGSYDQNGQGDELCYHDQGNYSRYGAIRNGQCWVEKGNDNRRSSGTSNNAKQVYVKNPRWIIP